MNKAEAKEFIVKYIASFFDKEDFILKKRKDNVVEYIRKNNFGFDGFASSTVDYNPSQIIRYSLFKRLEKVESITSKINERVELSPPIDKSTVTIAFSYTTINNLNKDTYLPEMVTEKDVEKCIEMVISFLRETAFPLLDRFNDVKEIDKEINGNFFWETDWRKPFNLGGNFDVKRLVIAKLANNNDFVGIVDKTYKSIEKLSLENGHPFVYNRNDLSMPIPWTVNILKDIEPLKEVSVVSDPNVFDWVVSINRIKDTLRLSNCLTELKQIDQSQTVLGTPGEMFLSVLDALIRIQKSASPCSESVKDKIDEFIRYARHIGYY